MDIAKVTSKGQITIPKSVRDDLELEAGSKVLFIQSGDGWKMISPDQKFALSKSEREKSDEIKQRFLAEMAAEYDLDYPVETDQSKPISQLLDELREGFAGVAEAEGWETEQDIADYINSNRQGDKR